MKTVLVVDDDADTVAIFRAILEHGGYSVVSTADPRAVVSLAVAHHADLVLLDLHLPGALGYDIAAELCTREATASIPIIAVSADVQPHAKIKALESGCDHFVTKPVEPKTLLHEVNTILAHD